MQERVIITTNKKSGLYDITHSVAPIVAQSKIG